MKDVSWEVAFRKLKQWRDVKATVSFGVVKSIESQGETTEIFSGDTGWILDVDEKAGIVKLPGVGELDLVGASFRFSDFSDSPFVEADLLPWQFEEQLEATFPDGTVWVFAKEWEGVPS